MCHYKIQPNLEHLFCIFNNCYLLQEEVPGHICFKMSSVSLLKRIDILKYKFWTLFVSLANRKGRDNLAQWAKIERKEGRREIKGQSYKEREETRVSNKGRQTFTQTHKVSRLLTDKEEEQRIDRVIRTAVAYYHVLYCVSVFYACSSQ